MAFALKMQMYLESVVNQNILFWIFLEYSEDSNYIIIELLYNIKSQLLWIEIIIVKLMKLA